MKFIVEKSTLKGSVEIPASKSHSVRAAIFATLADGESNILSPLDSLDTQSAVSVCRAFGGEFLVEPNRWVVNGTNGDLCVPDNVVDVLNSGTTLYIVMATAGLVKGTTVLTGDDSIRKRPCNKLMKCLRDLGVEISSTRGNDMCPLVVKGPMKGGHTSIEAITSQWVTAILMNAPLADGDTELLVPILNEAPYVQMTLDWLDFLGVRYEQEDLRHFKIPGGQGYRAFKRRVPGDFSSATFFLAAGAALDARLELRGLDMHDSQGDKAVVDFIKSMGARVAVSEDSIKVQRKDLKGCEIDLNATPDALPAMAVVAALGEGETRLVNVPQARVKETDRIAVMAAELGKMGAKIEELEDGMVIQGGSLTGAKVHGHHDHRVVMALTLAGLAADGETEIDTAESAAITFPNFAELMQSVGAKLRVVE